MQPRGQCNPEAEKTVCIVAQRPPPCPGPSWALHSAELVLQHSPGLQSASRDLPCQRCARGCLQSPSQSSYSTQPSCRNALRHTTWRHGFCAAEFSLAAPSDGYSHCSTPWVPPGALAVWQPHRQVLGGSWGDPALAKHRSPERVLQSLPSLGHSGEKPRSPGSATPLTPSSPEGMRGKLGHRHCDPHREGRCRVHAWVPPLTTEYP